MLFLLDSLHCLKWVIFLLKVNFCSRTGVLWSVEICAFFVLLYFSCCCWLFTTHMTDILASLWTNGLFYLGTSITEAGVVLHCNEPGQPTAKHIEEFCFPLAVIFCDLSYPCRNGTYCLKYYSIILLLYKSLPTFPLT